MNEERVEFAAGQGLLEGLLLRNGGELGAIVTHPHPLYGGDMHNPVVGAVAKACLQKGYSTLRFNFRGAGRSQGKYGGGFDEVDDVFAAVAYIKSLGVSDILLAGYSFGSFVLAHMPVLPDGVTQQLYVAPPVAFMDFAAVKFVPVLKTVITGEFDDIAPPAQVLDHLKKWNTDARLHILSATDHFYSTGVEPLREAVAAHI